MCKGKSGDSAHLGTIARDAFDSTKIFAARLTPSEKRYEARFQAVFDTIRQMLKDSCRNEKSHWISREFAAPRKVRQAKHF
jgi:hypothetical protein